MSNGLDPDADMCPNCLQRLSTDNKKSPLVRKELIIYYQCLKESSSMFQLRKRISISQLETVELWPAEFMSNCVKMAQFKK